MDDVVTYTSYVNALVAGDCPLVDVKLIEHVPKGLVEVTNPLDVQTISALCSHTSVTAESPFLIKC
jgi:hypothetical protein